MTDRRMPSKYTLYGIAVVFFAWFIFTVMGLFFVTVREIEKTCVIPGPCRKYHQLNADYNNIKQACIQKCVTTLEKMDMVVLSFVRGSYAYGVDKHSILEYCSDFRLYPNDCEELDAKLKEFKSACQEIMK
jgi:hypothetical protein